jgi:hypothetical protein
MGNVNNSLQDYLKSDEETLEEIRQRHPAIVNIRHPSRTLVMGKSQSGKTTMAVEIACHLLPSVKHLVICSPTFNLQPTWKPLKRKADLTCDCLANLAPILQRFINSLNGESCLLVLDDVSGERALNTGSSGPLSQIAYNAIWLNLSIVVVCHRISNVNSGIRENLEHLILFQTISDPEKKKLSEHFSVTSRKEDFLALYNTLVTDRVLNGNPHAFMYICFKGGVNIYLDFQQRINVSTGS